MHRWPTWPYILYLSRPKPRFDDDDGIFFAKNDENDWPNCHSSLLDYYLLRELQLRHMLDKLFNCQTIPTRLTPLLQLNFMIRLYIRTTASHK